MSRLSVWCMSFMSRQPLRCSLIARPVRLCGRTERCRDSNERPDERWIHTLRPASGQSVHHNDGQDEDVTTPTC